MSTDRDARDQGPGDRICGLVSDPEQIVERPIQITHWKADVARSARGLPRPPEQRGLAGTQANHLIYLRWRDRSPQEVLAWHWQVDVDLPILSPL